MLIFHMFPLSMQSGNKLSAPSSLRELTFPPHVFLNNERSVSYSTFLIFTFAARSCIICADNKEHAETDDSEWI